MCFLDVDGENDVFGNRLEFVLPRMMYYLGVGIRSTTTTSKLHFISTGFACQRFEHG